MATTIGSNPDLKNATEDVAHVGNDPFAFSPQQLSMLTNPKNYENFLDIGGLAGLEDGLKTDIQAGISIDEEFLLPTGLSTGTTEGVTREKPLPSSRRTWWRAKTTFTHGESRSGPFADRRRVFGENSLPEKKTKPLWKLAWIAIQDKVLVLLSVAAVVSLALGLYQTFGQSHHDGARVEWVEGVAIIIAIVIVVGVGAVNDWQKERQFAKLNQKREDRQVKVIRSGKTIPVSVHEVFVGDVMVLEQGDVLPVDGIYIEGSSVRCDESSATGESDLIKKMPADQALKKLQERGDTPTRKLDPFLISGTKVAEGFGSYLVTAVGIHSNYGKTMASLQENTEATPLQFKLAGLAGYIAKIGSTAGLLLFAVLLIEFLARLPGNQGTSEQKGQQFLQILITSITIIVVAVPEGLPLAVTLALAFATKRMTRDNNLVRHLQSCETMGNATVICSDKTGTLTQNVMTVVAGTIGAGSLSFGTRDKLLSTKTIPSSEHSEPNPTNRGATPQMREKQDEFLSEPLGAQVTENELSASLPAELRELLKVSIVVNSTAFEGAEKGVPTYIGSKTETALLEWAKRNFDLGTLTVERANYPLEQLFPFDSRRKFMGAVVQHSNAKFRLFVKGAPEVVLGQCTTVLSDDLSEASPILLRDSHKTALNRIISRYAHLSLRTIAIAYREFDQWPPPENRTIHESSDQFPRWDVFENMTLLAALAIQDPVRPGVPEAVQACQRASVLVKMVTGDNIETARAIAIECGIMTETDGLVMDGGEFRQLSEHDMRLVAKNLRVLARTTPEDKKILVKTLKSLGEIVAVTGDGTNDAAALRAADVGFSMGVAGTEVAKEASDIILMDDNFSSIVKALAWGRTVNDSVKKFLQFQITVNITAVVLTFVSGVSDDEESAVLNAVQLLWVNLIMDTFAALALATDPPNTSVMDRKPEPRNMPLISYTMWKMILGQSIYQLVACFVLYYAGPKFLNYPELQLHTLIFNAFVWMQIFKLVNSRRIDNKLNVLQGLHKNWIFMVMFCLMAGGQTIIIFFAGQAFEVTRLNGVQWAISLVLGFMSIPMGVVIRLIPDTVVSVPFIAIAKALPNILKRRKRGADTEDRWSDVDDPLLDIKTDLTYLKQIRGGRLGFIDQGIANPRELRRWRSRPRSRSSVSAMHAAMAMPGVLAGSVGGLSTHGPEKTE